MLQATITNELAHLYSLWSTSPLSRSLLVNILWYYIYKCTGMAPPGILGTLRFEGRGRAGFEQNGFRHSTWSSAGNQTHSWLSTEIKSPSTGITSVKPPFCSIAITGKCKGNTALIQHFAETEDKTFLYFSEIGLQESFLGTSKGIL